MPERPAPMISTSKCSGAVAKGCSKMPWIDGWNEHTTESGRSPTSPSSRVIGEAKPYRGLTLITHAWGDGPALSDEKRLEQGENSTAGRSESIRVMAG